MDREKDTNNDNLLNTIRLIKKIGKGSFGNVYKSYNYNNKKFCATKSESIVDAKKKRLLSEHKLYERFQKYNISTVPKEYLYTETPDYAYMTMQLLGKSLDKVMKKYDGKLDLGTTMKIATLAITCLEQIHSTGIIHRDIKPNNFMFGNKDEDETGKLYIVDFGLSREFFKIKTKQHIDMKQGRPMIGTARYVSIRTHQGFEPSRRDDMESLGHMFVYLVKGRLPWQGLPKKKNSNGMDKIRDKKMSTSLSELCDGLPECFSQYLEYTRNMTFKQRPDYEYLRSLFIKSGIKHNIELVLDWKNTDDE
jgi:serine/threonine protein kinase